MAILKTLEPGSHRLRPPAVVSGQLLDVFPVVIEGVDEDLRVVRSASAQGSGARIEDAIDFTTFPFLDIFPVESLRSFVRVVANKEIPSDRFVLRSERMEGGHIVVVRQAVGLGIERIAAF